MMWKYLKFSSVKQSFENIKYGSYPQNADIDYLIFESEQRFFTKRPIDCLINNIEEILKISTIKQSL